MGRPDLNRLAQNKDVRAFVNEYVSCSYIFALTRIVIEVIFDYVARARARACVYLALTSPFCLAAAVEEACPVPLLAVLVLLAVLQLRW